MARSRFVSSAVRLVSGALLVAMGVLLLLNSASAIQLIIWLLSAGLLLAGLLRLLEMQDNASRRAPVFVAGLLLILSAFALPLARSASLPVLALCLSLALFFAGALRFASMAKGSRTPAFRGILTALTGVFGAVVSIFWPRLSLWVLGVVFGMWLVLLGLRALSSPLRNVLPAPPQWMRAVGSAGLTGLAIFGLMAVMGLGALTAFLHSQSSTSSADDFYLPPASVPNARGELIRSEPLAQQALENTEAWRILYTTASEDGSAAIASGIVTVPRDARGALPVISWANGTKGIASQCALSASPNPYDDGPAIAREEMLSRGWAIVATDYVGLGTAGPHPYLVPQAEAHAVLDATRAAAQLDALAEQGMRLDERSVVWGHSQGGHAALATAKEAKEYAPDLDILGVAAMAPASDLPHLAESIADTSAGKIVSSYIAASWNELYPQMDIADRLTPRSELAVNQLSKNCFTGAGAVAGVAQASQLFEPVFSPEALDHGLSELLEQNSAPIPKGLPIFLSQGATDSLVVPSMQRNFVQASCQHGAQIGYAEYPGLDHMPLVGEGSALNQDLVRFTQSLLEGETAYPKTASLCGK